MLTFRTEESPFYQWANLGCDSCGYKCYLLNWKSLKSPQSLSKVMVWPLNALTSATAIHSSASLPAARWLLGTPVAKPSCNPAMKVYRTECVSWKEFMPITSQSKHSTKSLFHSRPLLGTENTAMRQTQSLLSWSLRSSRGDWKVYGSFQRHMIYSDFG